MPARPEIFISAASRDLKSCRQLVRDALLTLGCVPIVQDHFTPGAGEVRAMLRERIAACHAVIHLVGECYGHEPQDRIPNDPRRSYTQLEYDIARELKKPLYTFLCAPDFPYDAHEPEPEELRQLQDIHRAALVDGDKLYVRLKDPQELELRVRELQTRVETFAHDLQKTRFWLGRGLAATAAALTIIAGLLYGVKHQGEQSLARSDEHAVRSEQQASKAERQIADLKNLLQEQTQAIARFSENFNRNAPAAGPGMSDPAGAAREETARQLGLSTIELQKQLATENTDTRALLARIREGRSAAEVKVTEWRKLQREALTKLGDAELAVGHYAATVEPFQEALTFFDESNDPLGWCDAAQRLEVALDMIGNYADAKRLALGIVEKRAILQSGDSPATLISVHYLANVLYNTADYAAAEPLYRRCLEAWERKLGDADPITLVSKGNLAILLKSKGDYAAAEPLLRRCLEAQERTLGGEHRSTLDSMNVLACLLSDTARLTEAETLHRRCLEARERTLGKEHPDTLASVNNLADLLRIKGDLTGAEALDRRCLEAEERTLGNDHPFTLDSVNNLGTVLAEKGNLREAETQFRRCLEARERTLGKEHPATLASINNLALLLSDSGDYAGAEALDRRCLDAYERTLGKEHPITALTAFNLTLLEQKQGKLREALPLAEEAVAAARASLPEDHPARRDYERNLKSLRAELATASPHP